MFSIATGGVILQPTGLCKKQTPPEATKTVYPILRQIVNLILPNIFHAAASATKDLSRVFTPWSHAVALIYQQLTKTESLNGVCDAARVHASQWQELRGEFKQATLPAAPSA